MLSTIFVLVLHCVRFLPLCVRKNVLRQIPLLTCSVGVKYVVVIVCV